LLQVHQLSTVFSIVPSTTCAITRYLICLSSLIQRVIMAALQDKAAFYKRTSMSTICLIAAQEAQFGDD